MRLGKAEALAHPTKYPHALGRAGCGGGRGGDILFYTISLLSPLLIVDDFAYVCARLIVLR